MKKYISLIIIVALMVSILPMFDIDVNAFSSEQAFFDYLDSQNILKRSYKGLLANWNTYETYNLIVYGNPYGDTKYSLETGRTEYRYLGYTFYDDPYYLLYLKGEIKQFKPDPTNLTLAIYCK